jgi:hypothetical protein
MGGGLACDLLVRRVTAGVRPGAEVAARLSGGELTICGSAGAVAVDALSLPEPVGDVRAYIAAVKATAPVLPACVTAGCLATGAVTLAKLDPASPPLAAALGGTGASSAAAGAALYFAAGAGGEAGAFDASGLLSVTGETGATQLSLPAGAALRLLERDDAGVPNPAGVSGEVRVAEDRYGRRSLFLYHGPSANEAVAPRVNLINPRYSD